MVASGLAPDGSQTTVAHKGRRYQLFTNHWLKPLAWVVVDGATKTIHATGFNP